MKSAVIWSLRTKGEALAVVSFLLTAAAGVVPGVSSSETLYRIKGTAVSENSRTARFKQSWYEAERQAYDTKVAIIDNDLIDDHIEQTAKKKGKTVEQIEEELFKVAEPSEQDVKDWYEKNKDRIQYPFEQIKGEIGKVIQSEKQREVRDQLLTKIKADGKFELLLKEPIAPKIEINTEGFPASGNLQANVTIVEFADYQCPHCAHAFQMFQTLKKNHGSKFKMVFMDFPINRSGISRTVAEGAFCAFKQGKFWEYHEKAFSNQAELSKDSPKKFASELQLDNKSFESCLNSDEAKKHIEKSEAEGKRIGIQGTPTVFVNGQKIAGHSEEELLKAITSAGT